MIHRIYLLCAAVMFPALAGCQGYDVTINERVVYSPVPLLKDFEVTDPALQACLEATIEHQVITRIGQLTSLNCSNAGITDLAGLAAFEALGVLRLSSNKIRNLVELQKLVSLRELYLDDNVVVDPVPLYSLRALETLDLTANATLQCPRNDELRKVASVALPQHCR